MNINQDPSKKNMKHCYMISGKLVKVNSNVSSLLVSGYNSEGMSCKTEIITLRGKVFVLGGLGIILF